MEHQKQNGGVAELGSITKTALDHSLRLFFSDITMMMVNYVQHNGVYVYHLLWQCKSQLELMDSKIEWNRAQNG